MKLYYYKGNNFGDKLNLWLWPKLLPNFLDEKEDELFVGIGTLLNDNLQNSKRKIIFGAGVGYGKAPLKIDGDSKVYFVRGPLSAKKLKLGNYKSITDGAVLVKKIFNKNINKKYEISYIPHRIQWIYHKQEVINLCKGLSFNLIKPSEEPKKYISEICKSEKVITEAMHGAIIADLCRIPWIPIETNWDFNCFKWEDWCSSLNMRFKPNPIYGLHNLPWHKNPQWACKVQMRKNIRRFGLNSLRWIYRKKMDNIKGQLLYISKKVKPSMSKDNILDLRFNQAEEKLEELKKDYSL